MLAVSNRSLISGTSERDVINLLLGELDFKLLKIKREFSEVSSVFQHLACTAFVNTIESNRRERRVTEGADIEESGYFSKIKIYGKAKRLVIFVQGRRAFLPLCQNVSTIFLSATEDAYNINRCNYRDMPIEYVDKKGMNASGFLTSDMIIQHRSRQLEVKADCSLTLYMNSSMDIVQTAYGAQHLRTVTSETVDLPVRVGMAAHLDLRELNEANSHHKLVSAGSDMLKQVSFIVGNAEHDANFETSDFKEIGRSTENGYKSRETRSSPSFLNRLGSAVSEGFRKLKSSVYSLFAWIGLIFIIVCSIFFLLKCLFVRCRRNQIMSEMV
jgi:hypothetical protein